MTSAPTIDRSACPTCGCALYKEVGHCDGTKAIALLRAWVAGCGDEHFSTKDQCRELLEDSGNFLSSLK